MRKNKSKLSALVVATSMAMVLSACGSDNDDKKDDHNPVEATAQFIDAAVANLDVYQNNKKIDTTDSEGMFTYMTGSEVTFKLGNLILGSTMPKAIITPADLAPNTMDVVEILQVLQSLDEDANPDNGIFVPQTTIDKLVTALDLSKDEVSIEDTVKKDIPDLMLVAQDKALQHFTNSQETVKTSNELSKVADKFVGYWQQSCENGNQQVIELSKDSSNANMLKQTGQYLNRKYDNDDCTGSYDETIGYSSTDPLTVTIMGTSAKDDKMVVNAIRAEGSDTSLDSLIMMSNDNFMGGDLTFSRKDSLAFDDEVTIDDKAEILAGYWASKCIESTNGSKKYYLNNVLQGDGSVLIKQALREDFVTKNCSGTSVISINEDSNGIIPQSDIDNMVLNGNNQFIVTDHTVETYDRISESDFPKVSEVPVGEVEQVVNAMVGYWKSECLTNDNMIVYSEFTKVNNTTIKTNEIEVTYRNNSCSGEPIKTQSIKGVLDFSQDKNAIPDSYSKNRIVANYEDENGNKIVEVYNRISATEFESVAVEIEENKTVPEVINAEFTPATGNLKATIVVTFNTEMSDYYATTGSYSPSNSYWIDSKRFIIEFDSYLPGGTITFAGYDEQGNKGFQNSSGLALENDYTFTFPN